MIDNFKTDLVLRVAPLPQEEILRAMGYKKPTSANLERLQTVLDDPEFGLKDSGFDFKYGSEGFLRALCVVTGIDMALADQRISRIKKRLAEEREAFKPYIWVDTGFVRKSQPIFALAVCEHQRYLEFPEGFWRFSIDRHWVGLNVVSGNMSMKPAEILEFGARSSSIGFTTINTQPIYWP